jgi:hypothetical protein
MATVPNARGDQQFRSRRGVDAAQQLLVLLLPHVIEDDEPALADARSLKGAQLRSCGCTVLDRHYSARKLVE